MDETEQIRALRQVVEKIALFDGPIQPEFGALILRDLATVMAARGVMSMRVLDCLLALITALREDITQ